MSGEVGAAVSRDGTRIDYERQGSGPALVLVHGGFVDRTFWGQSLPLLAQHYTVYAMDRRGHGRSDPYPADHDIQREYEDVAALVAAIGGPVALVGHSGGARVALHAGRRVDEVQQLVLYEPPRFDDVFTPDVLARLHASLEAGDLDDVLTTILVDVIAGDLNPGLLPGARPEVLAGMRQSPVWAAAMRNVRSIPAEADSYASYRFEPAEFRDFRTPTVLLLGGTSSPVMRGFVEDLQAALPVSRIMILEGQGHGAMLEGPELFVRTVRAALDWASAQLNHGLSFPI
jgi:pimeloyl-ACP methyl ester carboxylesterase